MRVLPIVLLALALPCLAAEAPSIAVRAEPSRATVGEPIQVTVTITLPEDVRLEPPTIGPVLGGLSVIDGRWNPADERDGQVVWTWQGSVSAFRPGESEIPAIRVRIAGDAGESVLESEPVPVTISSVLEEGQEVELADLKPPASVPPDFRALRIALGILLLLLVGAGVSFWLARRYASRLAAAALPEDPFLRTPPDVWVYAELQKLLERRLAEQGQIELFHAELSRILKQYLGGRYRVELMEQTSAEVPLGLADAGAPEEAIRETAIVLERCDRVKFARALPAPAEWKAAVEEVYRIVDRTRPATEPADRKAGAA